MKYESKKEESYFGEHFLWREAEFYYISEITKGFSPKMGLGLGELLRPFSNLS